MLVEVHTVLLLFCIVFTVNGECRVQEDMAKYCNRVKNLFKDIFLSETYSMDSLCMCETAHPENGSVRLRILRMAV